MENGGMEKCKRVKGVSAIIIKTNWCMKLLFISYSCINVNNVIFNLFSAFCCLAIVYGLMYLCHLTVIDQIIIPISYPLKY